MQSLEFYLSLNTVIVCEGKDELSEMYVTLCNVHFSYNRSVITSYARLLSDYHISTIIVVLSSSEKAIIVTRKY